MVRTLARESSSNPVEFKQDERDIHKSILPNKLGYTLNSHSNRTLGKDTKNADECASRPSVGHTVCPNILAPIHGPPPIEIRYSASQMKATKTPY